MNTISNNKYIVNEGIINPQSASYFLPVLSGLLLSLLTGIFILRPLIKETNGIYSDLLISRSKVSLLDMAEERYKIIKENSIKINNQKEDLLSLVAGETELLTLLDQLNILAKNYNVNIQLIKPNEIEYIVPTINNSNKDLDIIADPLLNENIIKYPYEINIEANFEQMLIFIRELEKLEIITALSNLEIEK